MIFKMNKKEHRIKIIESVRKDLCIMIFFFLTNLVGTILIIGNHSFLFWFNLICFMEAVGVVVWIDFYLDEIIEGGR